MNAYTPFILCSLLFLSSLESAVLFQEGFDSSDPDVTVHADSDTVVSYINYSHFEVAGTVWSLPESPSQM